MKTTLDQKYIDLAYEKAIDIVFCRFPKDGDLGDTLEAWVNAESDNGEAHAEIDEDDFIVWEVFENYSRDDVHDLVEDFFGNFVDCIEKALEFHKEDKGAV